MGIGSCGQSLSFFIASFVSPACRKFVAAASNLERRSIKVPDLAYRYNGNCACGRSLGNHRASAGAPSADGYAGKPRALSQFSNRLWSKAMKDEKIQFQNLDEVLRDAQLRRSADLGLWLRRYLQTRRESRLKRDVSLSSAPKGKAVYG
jgi:hypothetical protein